MYYLAMDGGGTKLIGLLFDDSCHQIALARTAGTNASVYSNEQIKEHISECYKQLFDGLSRPLTIECLYTICGITDLYCELLPQGVTLLNRCEIGEGVSGLYAAAFCHDGFVALSGTGSDAFCIKSDKVIDVVGGWGAILGDEGSGVWMCRQAMQAAIRAEQGWGESTVLVDLIKSKYKLTDLKDYLGLIYSAPAPYRMLGELLPTVAEAARLGDEPAKRIFYDSGQMLARQTASLLNRYDDIEPRIVACGGAWKAHPLMAESFISYMKDIHPHAFFEYPRFEHIMAGPIRQLMDRGENDDAHVSILTENFANLLWNHK